MYSLWRNRTEQKTASNVETAEQPEVTALRKEVSNLSKKYHECDSSLRERNRVIGDLEEKLGRCLADNDRLQKEVKASRELEGKLEGELGDNRAALDEAQGRLKVQSRQIAEADRAQSVLRQECEAKSASLDACTSELSGAKDSLQEAAEIRKELERQKEELSALLEVRSSELKDAQDLLCEADQSQRELGRQREEMSTQLETRASELQQAQDSLLEADEIQSELRRGREEIAALLKARVSELKDTRDRIRAADETQAELRKEREEILGLLEARTSDLMVVQEALQKANEVQTGLRKEREGNVALLEARTSELAVAQEALQTADRVQRELRREREDMSSLLNAYALELKDARDALRKADEDLSTLRKEQSASPNPCASEIRVDQEVLQTADIDRSDARKEEGIMALLETRTSELTLTQEALQRATEIVSELRKEKEIRSTLTELGASGIKVAQAFLTKTKNRWAPEADRIQSEAELRKDKEELSALLEARTSELKAAQEALRLAHKIRSKLRKEKEENLTLLKARTSELKAAQVFLTKTDSLSASEIALIVGDLNADIFQTAASLEDLFIFDGPRDAVSKQAESLAGILGPDVVHALATSDDTFFPQIALQGFLCLFASWISNSWHLQPTTEGRMIGRAYSDVYDALHANEPQAVAGRWRSLARRHIDNSLHRGTDLGSELYAVVERDICKILVAARCQAAPQEIQETIRKNCGERLRSVVDQSVRLNRIIGQDTISADMDCVYVAPGERFDPLRMEDTEAGHSPVTDDHTKGLPIWCTTGLGLRRVEKMETGAEGEDVKETALLKAKVVLRAPTEDSNAVSS